MGSIVVVVADGQRLVGEALGWALRRYSDLDVVDEHPTTGLEAVRAVSAHRADVAVIDYWMPEMDGPAATRMILSSSPKVRVLLLSWLTGPGQVQEALAAGAAAFLPKSITVEQLATGIRHAHEWDGLVYGEELARLLDRVNERYEEAKDAYRRVTTLTPRELQVLQVLGEGWAMKRVAIEFGITVGTVKKHIHNILAKTGATNQQEAVNMARYARVIPHFGPRGRLHTADIEEGQVVRNV